MKQELDSLLQESQIKEEQIKFKLSYESEKNLQITRQLEDFKQYIPSLE